MQSRGNFGTQADITLRGSTFNQVLILLDGMRLNDPLTGHFAGYFPITPAEIEQIEVVRGPGAALYGPDAVGGFINIVTKTFAATHRPDAVELAGTFLAGEYGLKSTNAGFYGQDKGLRLAGGILNNTASGQLLDLPGGGRNDFKLNTYSLSGAYQLTIKFSAAARASFDRRDYNAQNFYTTNVGDRARETTSRDWYQGQLRYEWNERSRTELQVVGTSSTDYYVYTPTTAASDHLMHYLNVQGQHQIQLSAKVRATVGGQADRRAVQSNDRGDHAVWHTGAFAVAWWRRVRPQHHGGPAPRPRPELRHGGGAAAQRQPAGERKANRARSRGPGLFGRPTLPSSTTRPSGRAWCPAASTWATPA